VTRPLRLVSLRSGPQTAFLRVSTRTRCCMQMHKDRFDGCRWIGDGQGSVCRVLRVVVSGRKLVGWRKAWTNRKWSTKVRGNVTKCGHCRWRVLPIRA